MRTSVNEDAACCLSAGQANDGPQAQTGSLRAIEVDGVECFLASFARLVPVLSTPTAAEVGIRSKAQGGPTSFVIRDRGVQGALNSYWKPIFRG